MSKRTIIAVTLALMMASTALAQQLIQALRLWPRERPRAYLHGAAGVLVGVPHVQTKAALEVGDDLVGGRSRR